MKFVFTPAEVKSFWNVLTYVPSYVNNRYAPGFDRDMIDKVMADQRYSGLHPFYLETVKTAEAMAVHADGFYPYEMMDERRPNEALEVKEYRKTIFEPKTKPTFTKIQNSLGKIRRSSDWSVQYPDNVDDFSSIRDGERLNDYCEDNFPYFRSVTNYMFTVVLRKYLVDPNAVIFIKPDGESVAINDYVRPEPTIFDSTSVLDFVDQDYAVLLNPFGAQYVNEKGEPRTGKRIYFVTTVSITTYDQINDKGEYSLSPAIFEHNLGYLPCFKLGGNLVKTIENYFLFESRIAGVIPELNEALRENSDLQAAKVLHIYPERWEYVTNDCKMCHGTGEVPNPAAATDDNAPGSIDCRRCGGQGYIPSGPYSKIYVKAGGDATQAGQQTIPSPPVGYVQKDVDIVKVLEDSVKGHIAAALGAINFDFLIEVPLSTSGVSKEYDRSESTNTSHAIAEDLVAIMDKIYKTTAYYRYMGVYNDKQKLDDMLPEIPVPENYDLYSISDAQKEITDAKTGKVNPIIINAMETDYCDKRFSTDVETKTRIHLILTLDPLPNISEDDKMSRLANQGITKEAYVISSNIQEFIQRAIEEDAGFGDKKRPDQKAVMLKYAEEVIKAGSSETKVVPINPADQGLPGQQQAPGAAPAPFNPPAAGQQQATA